MPPTTKSQTKSDRAGLIFPVGRVSKSFKKRTPLRVGTSAALATAAANEYLCEEILKYASKETLLRKGKMVLNRHLLKAINEDGELCQLFDGVVIRNAGMVVNNAAE